MIQAILAHLWIRTSAANEIHVIVIIFAITQPMERAEIIVFRQATSIAAMIEWVAKTSKIEQDFSSS